MFTVSNTVATMLWFCTCFFFWKSNVFQSKQVRSSRKILWHISEINTLARIAKLPSEVKQRRAWSALALVIRQHVTFGGSGGITHECVKCRRVTHASAVHARHTAESITSLEKTSSLTRMFVSLIHFELWCCSLCKNMFSCIGHWSMVDMILSPLFVA